MDSWVSQVDANRLPGVANKFPGVAHRYSGAAHGLPGVVNRFRGVAHRRPSLVPIGDAGGGGKNGLRN